MTTIQLQTDNSEIIDTLFWIIRLLPKKDVKVNILPWLERKKRLWNKTKLKSLNIDISHLWWYVEDWEEEELKEILNNPDCNEIVKSETEIIILK